MLHGPRARSLAALLLLVGFPALLAACGRGGNSGGGDDDDSATDDDDAAEPGVLVLDATPLDLGTVDVGSTATATIDLFNDGDGELTGTLSLAGSGWSLGGDASFALAPDESTSRDVVFAPTVDGPATTTVEAAHDGANESPQTLVLTAAASSDLSGGWAVTPQLTYLCDEGRIDIDVASFTILDNHPAITVQSNSPDPGGMTGSLTGDTTFSANRNVGAGPLMLNCGQDYTVSGTFTSGSTLTGTLNVVFSGVGCVECSDQSWSFAATR